MTYQPGKSFKEHEQEIIVGALKFFEWNRTKTAKALEICVRAIRNKIKGYRAQGIEIGNGQTTGPSKRETK